MLQENLTIRDSPSFLLERFRRENVFGCCCLNFVVVVLLVLLFFFLLLSKCCCCFFLGFMTSSQPELRHISSHCSFTFCYFPVLTRTHIEFFYVQYSIKLFHFFQVYTHSLSSKGSDARAMM